MTKFTKTSHFYMILGVALSAALWSATTRADEEAISNERLAVAIKTEGADPSGVEVNIEQMARAEVTYRKKDLRNKYNVGRNSPGPELSYAGFGLGAATGSTTGTGTLNQATAEFTAFAYGEGQDAISQVSWEDRAEGQTAGLRDSISYEINKRYEKELERVLQPLRERLDGAVPEPIYNAIHAEEERIRELYRKASADKVLEALEYLSSSGLETELREYSERAHRERSRLDSEVPLHLVRMNARYNMVGATGEGTYTGATGSLEANFGFSLKAPGEQGCDIYFAVHGDIEASGYHQFDEGNRARVAVGLEQGPICQIGESVTILASPSVQVGALTQNTGETVANTDWLSYSGRVRAIVDGRVYAAASATHHPSMAEDKGDSAQWSSTEIELTADYRVSDDWLIGAEFRHARMTDTNTEVTGNEDFESTYFGLSGKRAF